MTTSATISRMTLIGPPYLLSHRPQAAEDWVPCLRMLARHALSDDYVDQASLPASSSKQVRHHLALQMLELVCRGTRGVEAGHKMCGQALETGEMNP